MVLYLLSGSWLAVLFGLARYKLLQKANKYLGWLSIIHTYFLIAFGSSILATAPSFGNEPDCNPQTIAVIFRSFPALPEGRKAFWAVLVIFTLVYTLAIRVFFRERRDVPHLPDDAERNAQSTNLMDNALSERRVKMSQILISILWALAVLNTELLLVRNQFQPTNEPTWPFGQVSHAQFSCHPSHNRLQTMSLVFVVVPVVSTFSVYGKDGWGSNHTGHPSAAW